MERLCPCVVASRAMPVTCEGCGTPTAMRWSYATEGLWAGRWLCGECNRRRHGLPRLSLIVRFQFKLAQVLPPGDVMTIPVLRLLMAVDDVRRAQIQLIESHGRLDGPKEETHIVVGDFLYALRHLCSHLHEGGRTLRALDTAANARVDALLAGNGPAVAALQRLRQFFNSAAYSTSLIARIRNAIGFHYNHSDIAALVATVNDDTLLESTAADAGALARMADPVVREIMNTLAGGDFLLQEEHTASTAEALDIAGLLITVADHIFDALLRANPDAVVEKHEAVVNIPPLVQKAREAVEAARKEAAQAHER